MAELKFGFPFQNMYSVNISIPEGFQDESQPQPVVLKTPDGYGEFKYITKITRDNIQLLVNFKMGRASIAAEKYLFLKEFFNQVINKESEQIVLKKI